VNNRGGVQNGTDCGCVVINLARRKRTPRAIQTPSGMLVDTMVTFPQKLEDGWLEQREDIFHNVNVAVLTVIVRGVEWIFGYSVHCGGAPLSERRQRDERTGLARNIKHPPDVCAGEVNVFIQYPNPVIGLQGNIGKQVLRKLELEPCLVCILHHVLRVPVEAGLLLPPPAAAVVVRQKHVRAAPRSQR